VTAAHRDGHYRRARPFRYEKVKSILIINKAITAGRITAIIVNECLGF
jgi:hypothetical protein